VGKISPPFDIYKIYKLGGDFCKRKLNIQFFPTQKYNEIKKLINYFVANKSINMLTFIQLILNSNSADILNSIDCKTLENGGYSKQGFLYENLWDLVIKCGVVDEFPPVRSFIMKKITIKENCNSLQRQILNCISRRRIFTAKAKEVQVILQ
jgi:hypothetical protein